MNIRKTTPEDFSKLYALALSLPELQVSATEPFLEEAELRHYLVDPAVFIYLAERDGRIIGFIHTEIYRQAGLVYASINYLGIAHDQRHQGIASQLYETVVAELKNQGVSYVYTWAREKSHSPDFFKKHGFIPGHKYLWMDKKI